MKIIRSIRFASDGIKTAWRLERNFKIQIVVTVITIALGIVFGINSFEWMALLLCCALVLSLELVNSAVERICNFLSPGVHPAIKKIKDYAAGAVFISAVFSVITGLIIFLPKIIKAVSR